jgi:hypothetical protein
MIHSNFREVSETYHNFRRSPAYLSITPENRGYIYRLVENYSTYARALSDDNDLTKQYESMIQYLSNITRYARCITEIPSYTIHSGEPHELCIESKLSHRQLKFRSSTHSTSLNETVMLTGSTINHIRTILYWMLEGVDKVGGKPYQIVLMSREDNSCYNTTPGNLQKDLDRLLEKHAGNFSMDVIAIHVMHKRRYREGMQYVGIIELRTIGIPYAISVRDILSSIECSSSQHLSWLWNELSICKSMI